MLLIRVRFFAFFMEIVGCEWLTIKLPAGSFLSDLRDGLSSRFPNLQGILEKSSFALNGELVDLQMALNMDDEVAVLPPSSGG